MEGVSEVKLPKLVKNSIPVPVKRDTKINISSNLKTNSMKSSEKLIRSNFKMTQASHRNSIQYNQVSVKNNLSVGKVKKSEIKKILSNTCKIKLSLDTDMEENGFEAGVEAEDAKITNELEEKFESDFLQTLNQRKDISNGSRVKFIEFFFNNEKEAFCKTIFMCDENFHQTLESLSNSNNLFSKFFQSLNKFSNFKIEYTFTEPDTDHFLQNKIFYKSYKRVPACITSTLNFCSKSSSTKTSSLIWKLYKFEKMMKLIPCLSKHQKYNHFPKTFQLGRKDHLYRNFRKLHSKFPKDYTYMPITYIFPQDVQKFQSLKKLSSLSWIVKPVNSSRGRGIHLLTDLNQIPLLAAKSQNKNCEYLISKYLDNPHLINSKKYDLRIYVLITSYTPIKIYIYEEGLVRFASENYTLESKENIYVHLTNYAINKKNKNYEKNEEKDEEDSKNNCEPNFNSNSNSHSYLDKSKWSLSQYRKYFKENNLEREIELIFSKIKDIVIKSILSAGDESMQYIRGCIKYKNSLFELYGFDIFIDDKFNPWLLEVNVSPSLNCDSNLDLKIKSGLIRDMLNIVGLDPYGGNGQSQGLQGVQGEMTTIPVVQSAVNCIYNYSSREYNSKFNLSKFKVKVCKDFKENMLILMNNLNASNFSENINTKIFDFSAEEKQIFSEISNYPEYQEMVYNYITEFTKSQYGKFEMIFPKFDEIENIKYYSQFLVNPGDDNILLWKWINCNYNKYCQCK